MKKENDFFLNIEYRTLLNIEHGTRNKECQSLFDIRYSILLLSIIVFSFFSSCNHSEEESLNIATAANMQFAMEALVEAFEEKTKIDCEIILSSSGKLTAQIKEGAPYDVLISANMKFPNKLFTDSLTQGKPEIYAYGKLVLWSTLENFTPSIQKLTDPKIKHIALANPKTAPYGEAAIELLQKLNLYKKLKDQLVFGESISQTNQFITSQAAEIGFTAKAVVLSPRLKDLGTWIELEENTYQPIEQGIVILKNRPSQIEKAKQFHTFIFSKEGQDILEQYGYLIVSTMK